MGSRDVLGDVGVGVLLLLEGLCRDLRGFGIRVFPASVASQASGKQEAVRNEHVWGLGFRVQGSGLRVWALGFRV